MDQFFIRRPEIEKHFINFIESDINHLVMVGHAGVGKTTLLRYFFEKYESEKIFDKVIYISGRNLNSLKDLELKILKEIDINEWNSMLLKQFGDSISKEELPFSLIIHEFKYIKILLIVDGLDEIPNIELQNDISIQLQRLIHSFKHGSKLVSSSRLVFFDKLPSSSSDTLAILEIGNLSKDEIKKLIDSRFQHYASTIGQSKEEFRKKIQSLNLDKFPPLIIDLLFREFNNDFKLIESFLALNQFNYDSVLNSYLDIMWKKLSIQSQHVIRMLLLFETTVSIEKLSLLVDTNEEDFLDSLNELKSFGLINITGSLLSFSHKTLHESMFRYLEKPEIARASIDLYFDLDYIEKSQILELLNLLNETYQAIGGDELIIKESEIGQFTFVNETVNV